MIKYSEVKPINIYTFPKGGGEYYSFNKVLIWEK